LRRRVARQHEILRLIGADEQPEAAAAARRLLVAMETTLSAMRDHLRFEEQGQDEGDRIL
jgi:hypothetical protein